MLRFEAITGGHMRRIGVLLLVSMVASTSFANATLRVDEPNDPTLHTLTPDGKIMLGLDGRGNYRKAKKTLRAAPVETTATAHARHQHNHTSDHHKRRSATRERQTNTCCCCARRALATGKNPTQRQGAQ
jgi:hypothetical protein